MNIILIILDSFRQDHVGIYHQGKPVFPGIPACQTPNIDKFSKQCLLFENAYPEAFPTIPIRMQLLTGQRTLPFRGWEPLKPSDVTLTKILRQSGFVTGIITDNYHYQAPGMNYFLDFKEHQLIRGQEYDPYRSRPTQRNLKDYINSHFTERYKDLISIYLANTDEIKEESDGFPMRVVNESIRWLKENKVHKNKFLVIDSFDPHEPWDPPKRFDTYTDPKYKGPRLIMPMGGKAQDWANEEEINFMRGLYAGEASFVDYSLGPLFETIEKEGYLDDSMIILMADHGHPLGDHGKFLKGADRLYNELMKVPFMIHLPKMKNASQRTKAIIQFHDFMPTVLDFLGMKNNLSTFHGKSFLNILEGKENIFREHLITGYHAGIDRVLRDEKWTYIHRPEGEPDELYDLDKDPKELNNLIDKNPEEAQRLRSHYGSLFFRKPTTEIKGIQGKYELASGTVE